MPRHSREDDRRRSSPYHSSEEQRSHHHQKHKVRDSDDGNGSRRKDTQSTGRYHGSRSNDEDYLNRGNQESSRYHKHGNDRDKHYRPRSPSRSDGNPISKRSSGFDVGPPGAAALPNQSEGNFGISCPAMLLMGLRV